MSSKIEPEYRLRSLQRKLGDLLMGRRLAADSESTGIVDLSDYGRRLTDFAGFCAQSVAELGGLSGREAACARRAAEEAELAAKSAALLETLPLGKTRVDLQCSLLEEAEAGLAAALRAGLRIEEEPVAGSLAALARKEVELFRPFVEIEGEIARAPPGEIPRGEARRALRRALLQNAGGKLAVSVSGDGTLRFLDREFRTVASEEDVPRSADEPPEVRRALDLRAAATDPALRDFLLVKAVEEAVVALVAPRLGTNEWLERARTFPRKPGKRFTIRPEAVTLMIPGWEPQQAAIFLEKLAERRAGPEWARLPKAAYPIRLLLAREDGLAEDLLFLGPVLRRMEKGEAVQGAAERAARALKTLLGGLG